MHWLKCSLLATILCTAYCQETGAQTESSIDAAKITLDPKENETNLKPSPSVTQNVAESLTNATTQQTDVQVSLKSSQEPEEVENATVTDIKPFLLFPILPFLFPPREDENLSSSNEKFSTEKNDTAKTINLKPFIFFDFAFNIRRIPLKNTTDSLNDSKIINVKKLGVSKGDDPKENSWKNRRRRNTDRKVEKTPRFFDDFPLFSESDLDEFLPKPDLFFPDLPSHEKSFQKLSRRKRDRKKTELKDSKSFFDGFDAVDEAFMQTKSEFEWADPIFDFLRGKEQAFDEEKEANNLFGQPTDVQEKPTVKWRIQENIKRLNGDRQGGLPKAQESPTIIVDKVVKIGEFHVHDEGQDKNKSNKKREMSKFKREFLMRDNFGEKLSNERDEETPMNVFESIKEEESQKKRRNHVESLKPSGQVLSKVELRQLGTPPQMNISFLSIKKRAGGEEKDPQPERNVPEKQSKNDYRDTLKRNISELIRQFLVMSKNLDDAKLMEKLEVSERDDGKAFDWTEKETLENANGLGKGSKDGRRQKKDAYFEDEYVNLEKKERQVADLNYLFLNVTLSTVFVFAFVLFVCFFSLQVKGKICSKLFRLRQVFIVNDETSTQLKSPMRNSGVKKLQNI